MPAHSSRNEMLQQLYTAVVWWVVGAPIVGFFLGKETDDMGHRGLPPLPIVTAIDAGAYLRHRRHRPDGMCSILSDSTQVILHREVFDSGDRNPCRVQWYASTKHASHWFSPNRGMQSRGVTSMTMNPPVHRWVHDAALYLQPLHNHCLHINRRRCVTTNILEAGNLPMGRNWWIPRSNVGMSGPRGCLLALL